MDSNPYLKDAKKYYNEGVQEQEKFKNLGNDYQAKASSLTNPLTTPVTQPVSRRNIGSGVRRKAGGSFAPVGGALKKQGGSFTPLGKGLDINKSVYGARPVMSKATLGAGVEAAISSQQFVGIGHQPSNPSDPPKSAIHERMARLRELKALKRKAAEE